MVDLPGMGKKRRRAAGVLALPAAIEAGAADGGSGNNVAPVPKRSKVEPPSPAPPATPQDVYFDILGAPPLGLRLRKSPSLLDLIEMKLAMENSISQSLKKKDPTLNSGERFKASNFPANVLEIGSWKYTSCYEGDLVAKCYFAKNKLVWEVLDDGLKRKIEFQWSDIIALKAHCSQDENGTLELALARPPLFFKECEPQPRKHTLWRSTSDFTGGQASLYRRHVLQGPSNLLIKNFEKIIQCDRRLNQLSQLPDIILSFSVFENAPTNYGFVDVEEDGGSQELKNLDGSSLLNDDHPFLHNEISLKERLPEIYETLFSESDIYCSSASDHEYVMARVKSLGCLIEGDTTTTTIPIVEPNANGDWIKIDEATFDGFDMELGSIPDIGYGDRT